MEVNDRSKVTVILEVTVTSIRVPGPDMARRGLPFATLCYSGRRSTGELAVALITVFTLRNRHADQGGPL